MAQNPKNQLRDLLTYIDTLEDMVTERDLTISARNQTIAQLNSTLTARNATIQQLTGDLAECRADLKECVEGPVPTGDSLELSVTHKDITRSTVLYF